MTTGIQTQIAQEDKPLTRADVEQLLREVGSSDKLNLSGRNLSGIDLASFSLRGATLRNVNLHQAELFRADLSETDLSGANLSEAYLSGTILAKANLTTTALYKTDLTGADLREATLMGASLNETTLYGTDFSHAYLQATTFGNVDISIAEGLETVNHLGASTIGIDTITQSKGKIPLIFLRNTGVPDEFIDFVRSLSAQPIDYYSCFLSYSHQDEALARRLHADLQANGVRCWFAPEDMRIGDKVRLHIDESIHLYDKLILVLSEHAVQSTWVEREVVAAREKEDRQQREVLFPIRLDDTVMMTDKAWAADVRRRWHIGDFTNWMDPKKYESAFERLLRDLKTTSVESSIDQEEQGTEPLAEDVAFRIRVVEEPLSAQNLTMIISALTELSTKCWLIAKGRFADLIEYTQTRNGRFAEEAQIVVGKVTHSSPWNMDWKIDISAPSVADGLAKGIDAITQRDQRKQEKELENQARELELQLQKQHVHQDSETALIEQERQRLELEKQRLDIQEKRLELQEKRLELQKKEFLDALEIAGMMVDLSHPGADPATRAMEIQALLPNVIQLQQARGFELALPKSDQTQK